MIQACFSESNFVEYFCNDDKSMFIFKNQTKEIKLTCVKNVQNHVELFDLDYHKIIWNFDFTYQSKTDRSNELYNYSMQKIIQFLISNTTNYFPSSHNIVERFTESSRYGFSLKLVGDANWNRVDNRDILYCDSSNSPQIYFNKNWNLSKYLNVDQISIGDGIIVFKKIPLWKIKCGHENCFFEFQKQLHIHLSCNKSMDTRNDHNSDNNDNKLTHQPKYIVLDTKEPPRSTFSMSEFLPLPFDLQNLISEFISGKDMITYVFQGIVPVNGQQLYNSVQAEIRQEIIERADRIINVLDSNNYSVKDILEYKKYISHPEVFLDIYNWRSNFKDQTFYCSSKVWRDINLPVCEDSSKQLNINCNIDAQRLHCYVEFRLLEFIDLQVQKYCCFKSSPTLCCLSEQSQLFNECLPYFYNMCYCVHKPKFIF